MHPILLNLGPITFRSYGVLLTLAFIVGTFIVWREGRRQGYNEEKILDLSIIALATGFIGARLYYALLNWSNFAADPLKIIFVWEGGLAFHGALLGGIIGVWYYIRRAKWPFLQVADFAALGVSLGIVIGRVGCLLNGDDYGLTTNLPWGVYFPGFLGKRHPTQAYEAIWMFLAYLILLQIYRQKFFVQKRGGRSGATFFSFLVLSGVGRFLIEFYRADTTIINGIRVAHIMSLLVATIGLVGLYWLSNRSWKQDLNLILSFFEKFNWREKFGLSIKVVTKGLNIITEFVGYLATHAASIPLLIKRKSWRKHD